MDKSTPSRRRVLRTTGLVALFGLAGCTTDALPGDEPSPTTEPEPTPTPEPIDSPTPEPIDSPTAEPTESPTPTATEELPTPHSPDEQHLHGTMVVIINGRTYHLGDKPWNYEEETGDHNFHFHDHDGPDRWHIEALDVTLGYAFEALPRLDVNEEEITFREHTYEAGDGTELSVTVNGSQVDDMDRYLLEEGDAIEIVIETDEATPTAMAE